MKKPSLVLSLLPMVVLVALIVIGSILFGDELTSGPSQIALLGGALTGALIAMTRLGISWENFRQLQQIRWSVLHPPLNWSTYLCLDAVGSSANIDLLWTSVDQPFNIPVGDFHLHSIDFPYFGKLMDNHWYNWNCHAECR